MSRFTLALAVVCGLLLSAAALAQDGGAKKPAKAPPPTAKGELKSADLVAKTFVVAVGGDQPADKTFRFDDQTKYSVDGKEATAEETLKVGAKIGVWAEAATPDVASKVAVTTAGAKGGKKGGEGGGKKAPPKKGGEGGGK